MKRYKRQRNAPFTTIPATTRILLRKKPSYIERHRRAFSFIGAVLVFSTFLVKEGKQEELQEIISSLDLKMRTFEIRGDTLLVSSQLLSMARSIDKLPDDLQFRAKSPVLDISENDTSKMLTAVYSELDRANASVLNTGDFLRDIPNSSALQSDLNRERQLIAEDMTAARGLGAKDVRLILDRINVTLSKNPKTAEEKRRADIYDLTLAIQEQQHQAVFRSIEVKGYTTQAWGAAFGYRGEIERLHQRYSILGFVLFVLLWLLGLYGRLFAVEGLTGGE